MNTGMERIHYIILSSLFARNAPLNERLTYLINYR